MGRRSAIIQVYGKDGIKYEGLENSYSDDYLQLGMRGIKKSEGDQYELRFLKPVGLSDKYPFLNRVNWR